MKYWILISLLLVLAGCGQYREGTALEFENVEFGSPEWNLGEGPFYKEEAPALFVLDPAERAVLEPYVEEDAPFLSADFPQQLLVVVFQGVVSDSPSDVQIESIYLDDTDIYVHTRFTLPDKDEFTIYGPYSHYHIVSIDEAAVVGLPTLTAHLIDADTQTELLTTSVKLGP